ncbi:TetR/AcrR family transcriptional regulator [Pararoseomonas indoligenes]|uniref:TetR/AcrR family transcriptional regulator n=1 Tax=Roseomonas indoligenes TaxID=2820811 RepID=UPI0031599410
MTRAQAAENRARVVETAARLFREHGFDGIGVDSLMREAGLTHGGFYKNFESKDALAAEACTQAMDAAAERWAALIEASGPDALARLADQYLSPAHRDRPGGGCTVAALAAEAGRRPGPLRATFGRGLRATLERLSRIMPGRSEAARRERAVAAYAGLVGTLVLARAAADHPELSDEILAAGRRAFGGAAPKAAP